MKYLQINNNEFNPKKNGNSEKFGFKNISVKRLLDIIFYLLYFTIIIIFLCFTCKERLFL